MLKCDKQTYKDLEFEKIQALLGEYCVGPTALRMVTHLKPVRDKDELLKFLHQTHELVQIRRVQEGIPTLDFVELTQEIKNLPIKNASLTASSFMNIRLASSMVNRLLYFFNKREKDYPTLYALFNSVEYTQEIITLIDAIFDRHGIVKDEASPKLFEIRRHIESARRNVNATFDRCIRKYLKKGYLSDTKESFYNNRRVLAVISSYKRDVAGQILGSSNSGNVTFIEPQETVFLNNELEQLKDDERGEVFLILQALTKKLAAFLPLIIDYQQLLTVFDFINAKSRLAMLLEANLPAISEEKHFDLIECYHPLLKLNNQELKKKTVPQRIALNSTMRMLVISGPNAGGKSITLKTVGLIQLMFQCGLLVPVHPNSKMCLFNALLTDIGDNQSIENELSTYSYRLKRMRHFLTVADKDSLLLLDEFGTGSDPDLGGALAEVFFETLYDKGSFGVITTHYSNIKVKADELPEAVNGCMLFDTETLHPLFEFSMGQPGSSFTFEVAQINGIPKKLINKAKAKLDKKKVEMDALLHDLQKKETHLSRLIEAHLEAQETMEEHRLFYEESKEKYEERIHKLRDKSEEVNKLLTLGTKLQQFIDKYKVGSKKKNVNAELLDELHKYIAREKSKIEEAKKEVRLKKQSKKKANKPSRVKDTHNQDKIAVGSRVKLIATRQIGEVEDISGEEVTVMFGFARMKVKKTQLSWVGN